MLAVRRPQASRPHERDPGPARSPGRRIGQDSRGPARSPGMVMAEYKDREHFIPLRKSELVDLLCGDEKLSQPDEDLFRHFCRLLAFTYHIEFNQRLEHL